MVNMNIALRATAFLRLVWLALIYTDVRTAETQVLYSESVADAGRRGESCFVSLLIARIVLMEQLHTRYCDAGCQKQHWSEHKIACKKAREETKPQSEVELDLD